MNNDSSMLGTEKIPKLFFSFSITVLAGLILNSVYTLTDSLFISHAVGDNAMGGISLILPFTILQGAIATTVGSGASAIVSRKLGEGRPEDAGHVTFNAMLIFYTTAVITTVLGFIFMNPLLRALGCTGELENYAREYFSVILAGNVFSTGFSSIIRAEGKMFYGLLIWVIPISINIALDALFILVLDMGVKGSAFATVICQFTSFSMSMLFFTRLTTQKFKKIKADRKAVTDIIGIGLPSLIQSGSLSIMSALFNNSLSEVSGEIGINAFAYISKLVSFGISPLTAFSSALVPIVSYNFGAKKQTRVKETVNFAFKISITYSIAVILLVQAIPELLIRIFTDNEDIIKLASGGIRIISFSMLFALVPMITGAYYQSLGNKKNAFIMFSSTLIFAVPMLLILPELSGISGVWISYTAASILAALLGTIMYMKIRRKSI